MIYLRSATPKASVATCRALGGHLSGIQQAGVHTGNVRKSARSSRESHDRTTRTAALGQRRDSSPEYLRFRGVARPTARREGAPACTNEEDVGPRDHTHIQTPDREVGLWND